MIKKLLIAITVCLLPSICLAIPSFPGAEGFGAVTRGGYGQMPGSPPTFYWVTNTNDSGAGSFRAAVEASGPRIVEFKTGGTINLSSTIRIDSPYLTIAGQTAPGDGICIAGYPIEITTHNVIIRGIRYRLGAGAGSGVNGIALLGGSSEVYNIIIDHSSISWATDENLSTYRNVHDITISWNIISEGINNNLHGMGFLIGHAAGNPGYGTDISVHHNLFAHNRERQPLFQTDCEVEIINNLIYNYQNRAIHAEDDSGETLYADIVGNYVKSGLSTGGKKALWCNTNAGELYLEGNIGPGRLTDTGDEWDFTDDSNCVEADNKSLVSVVRSTTYPITVESPTGAYTSVLASDGAGAIVPERDDVDARIVADVDAGTGTVINNETDVGGYPTLATGSAWTDTDSDGMPDDWEMSEFGDLDQTATTDFDGDGYYDPEEWFNGFYASTETGVVGEIGFGGTGTVGAGGTGTISGQ